MFAGKDWVVFAVLLAVAIVTAASGKLGQEVNSLRQLKKLPDCGVVLKPKKGADVIVTYVDPGERERGKRLWFWVEASDRETGLLVSAQREDQVPADMTEGDKITCLKGRLIVSPNAGRVLYLVDKPQFTQGSISGIPLFVKVTVKGFGGGEWVGLTPPVASGVGRNTDGLLVQVTGKACGYSRDELHEWFYLDDGSGVPNENGRTGIRVIRSIEYRDPAVSFPTMNGVTVTAEGICTSEWQRGPDRIRVLRVRYDCRGRVSDKVRLH